MGFRSIEISNFRGIEHLVLNDLGDINIIVGRNNSGKSSCLEAIALLASGQSGFKNLFDEDMLEYILFRRTKSELSWDYLLHTGTKEARIIGFKGDDSKTEGVLIGKRLGDIELSPNDPLVESIREQLLHMSSRERSLIDDRERMRRYQGTTRSIPTIKQRMYFYFNDDKEYLAELFESAEGRNKIISSKEKLGRHKEIERVLFVGNLEQTQADLHDALAEKGKFHEVLDRLRKNYPDIKDLRPIKEILYMFYNNSQVPVDILGDGFKVSLFMILSSHAITNGFIMIEEPENYLHPGLMIHTVEELILTCKEHKIQIFISTHSDEFIRFCLERAKDIDVSIIRMSKFGDKTETETMKKEEALKNINELGIDLRGF